MSARVFAPAKINLTLHVGRPRADGLHPLESAVVFADTGDWVSAAPAAELSLKIEGPFAGALTGEADNLVLRAARALAQKFAVTKGAALTLEKHLPIASGIGGGSSDAAAALKALRALWQIEASDNELVAIAGELGADVPVCVAAGPAWMTGAGERFSPFAAPTLDAVLVNAGAPSPTGAVYRMFDAMDLGGGFTTRAAPAWRVQNDVIGALHNDLFVPACFVAPSIAEVKAVLAREALAQGIGLSGSGATMFAIATDAAAAAALANGLKARAPSWWVQAVRLNA